MALSRTRFGSSTCCRRILVQNLTSIYNFLSILMVLTITNSVASLHLRFINILWLMRRLIIVLFYWTLLGLFLIIKKVPDSIRALRIHLRIILSRCLLQRQVFFLLIQFSLVSVLWCWLDLLLFLWLLFCFTHFYLYHFRLILLSWLFKVFSKHIINTRIIKTILMQRFYFNRTKILTRSKVT